MKPSHLEPVTFLGHFIAWDGEEQAYAIYCEPGEVLLHATTIELCCEAIAEVVGDDGLACDAGHVEAVTDCEACIAERELSHDCQVDGCAPSAPSQLVASVECKACGKFSTVALYDGPARECPACLCFDPELVTVRQ